MSFLGLAAHLAAGALVGTLYFCGLWWNARRFIQGARVPTSVALMIARFGLLGGVLTLVSLEGALPLLATALGVRLARSWVMHRIEAAAL